MDRHILRWRRVATTACFALAVGAAVLSLQPAMAFAPGGFAFFPGAKTHVEITEDAMQTIYTELGVAKITKSMKEARKQITDANREVDSDQFSSAKHFDGENFTGGQTRVVDLLDQVVTKVRANDTAGARSSLGSALHTTQDFYSHSNWSELGNAAPSAELGRPGSISNVSPPSEATCVDAPRFDPCFKGNMTTSNLTSGYYGKEDRTNPGWKCRHGGFFDKGAGRGGINKDSGICIGVEDPGILDSPHNDRNGAAASVATLATAQVFRDLKARLTDREFKALLGIGPSLGFAIDTTGSMGSIIAGVRSASISIVDARIGTDQEPSKYVLSPFNDPFVGPLTVTSDATAFKSAISGLFASGGGDCPELAMNGALNAVDASDEGGDVFLFTDASAKDAGLMGAVRSLATSKKVKVFFALFGSCSPYDPAYFSLANSSGGQVFILGRSEAGAVTQLSDLLSRNDAVDIEIAQGTISSTPKAIPFAVDSQTARLTVSFSNIDATTLTLLRPDGVAVTPSSAGVTTISLSRGVVYSVVSPMVGVWKAQIGGSGQYSLLVGGESVLALDEFRFVEVGGRPGHGGYFPISGLPPLGKTSKAMARISGGPRSVSFEFRDLDGNLIAPFGLTDTNAEANRLVGSTTVPTQSFRVYAVGADAGGASFQRLLSTVIVPQSITVTPPAGVDLGRGQVTTFIFEVRNDGTAGSFNFTASDTAHFLTSVTPASATLAAGDAVLVKVALTTPVAAAIGTRDTLTFNAVSTTNPDVRNFAVITTSVVATKIVGDVNGDGVVDCADLALIKASFGSKAGSRSFNPDVDVDVNGMIDIRDLAIVARQLPAGTVCK